MPIYSVSMRPFQFSLTSSTGGSLRLSVSRWRVTRSTVTTIGLGAAGGAAACLLVQKSYKQLAQDGQRIKIPRGAADAVAGAVGELAQIAVLYPLDTVKVRCQATGTSARDVVRKLLAKGSFLTVTRQLYAGIFGAALCSLAVGSLHWSTYCTAKRLTAQALLPLEPTATSSSTPTDTAAAPLPTRHITNLVASISSALVTALIEAPTELFRHNAQAGLMAPNFLREMTRVASRGGPSALYRGFLPYCFESWPYDVTELVTYGSLKDLKNDFLRSSHTASWLVSSLPQGAWDLAIGAGAGFAAVLLSMPFDCVKTYMQTHGSELHGHGVVGITREFFATGRRMVAKSGPGALYVGVVPRLLQQVPACMLCWWAIEACARALEPFVEQSGSSEQGGLHGHQHQQAATAHA